MEPHVKLLRAFRDKYLLTNKLVIGQEFNGAGTTAMEKYSVPLNSRQESNA